MVKKVVKGLISLLRSLKGFFSNEWKIVKYDGVWFVEYHRWYGSNLIVKHYSNVLKSRRRKKAKEYSGLYGFQSKKSAEKWLDRHLKNGEFLGVSEIHEYK